MPLGVIWGCLPPLSTPCFSKSAVVAGAGGAGRPCPVEAPEKPSSPETSMFQCAKPERPSRGLLFEGKGSWLSHLPGCSPYEGWGGKDGIRNSLS